MPRPLPQPLRQQIWDRFCRLHQPPAVIAAALHLHPRTVQHLLARFQQGGPETLRPSYGHAPAPHPLRDAARFLHQQHPTWGGEFLRIILQDRYPEQTIPSARTLQRWYPSGDSPPTLAGRKPSRQRQEARQPHEVWQVDAAEQKRLASGQQISWLRGVDEFSGAVLGTRVFPPGFLPRGAARAGARALPVPVRPLGSAPARAGGQRQPLGQL